MGKLRANLGHGSSEIGIQTWVGTWVGLRGQFGRFTQGLERSASLTIVEQPGR